MRKQALSVFGLFLVIGFTVVSAAAQSSVGYVVEIEGNWTLNDSNVLTQGEKLPAGGAVRRTSRSSSDRIVINDMQGNIFVSRNCESDNCSGSIYLTKRVAEKSIWNLAFDSVMEAIWGTPTRYSSHRSRGSEISEGVIQVVNGTADLQSILNVKGEQYLKWRVISSNSDAGWTQPVRLDKSAAVINLSAGLYEMNLLRSNGTNYEPLATAWVLAATPAEYEKARNSFQSAKDLTERWGDKVKPETKQIFLQATLDNLARKSMQ